MSGTVLSRCHGSSPQGFSSDLAMDRAHSILTEPKKSTDRDWKEIRQRLERKIAAAAAQAISGRPGGADNRKPRWATPPKQKERRLYQVKQEDKFTTKGANPRTGVVSPSNRTDSSTDDCGPRPQISQKWKVNGDQWVSVDVTHTPSPRSSPLSYKLAKTVSSAGSGSTDISSSDDWEDRFVVHMPSAMDPNPPSMTAEQIHVYQEKIRKLHSTAVDRHEMDASKPSTGSPTSDPKKTSSIPVLQKGMASFSFMTDSSHSISPPIDGPRQYFSPDEVGRARVSPVTDNPKIKQKQLFKKLREECFMGCVGVDEAGAKNPDEILLFPSTDDGAESQSSSTIRLDDGSTKLKLSGIPRASHAPNLWQNSGRPLVRVTAQKVVNRQRTTSYTTPLMIPSTLAAAHSSKLPKFSGVGSPNSGEQISKHEDNILGNFDPVNPSSKAIPQRSRLYLSSMTSKRPQKSKNYSSQTSPENDLFFENSSPGPIPGFAGIGSFLRRRADSPQEPSKPVSPGLDLEGPGNTTEKNTNFSSQGGGSIRLNPSDIFKNIPANGPPLDGILSPAAEARARKGLLIANQESPKTPSVAELDGFQVPQQLPSPPLSTSPSPTPQEKKVDTPSSDGKSRRQGKRDTHTIRMEIRAKAEKAKQGAAAAKSASERLAAARKHAERLAEAHAAYDEAKAKAKAKMKAQKVTSKTKESPDDLKQQKLNTERINEARKAYKEAKAKEEAERRAEARRREAKIAMKPPAPSVSSPQPTVPTSSTKPTRKTARKNTTRRQSTPTVQNKREPVKTSKDDEAQLPSSTTRDAIPADGTLSSETFYLALINFHDYFCHHRAYSHVLLYFEKLLQMVIHCFKVCKRLAETWLEYKRLGVLPQACVDEFGQFAGDIGQALLNFMILLCALIVIAKTAGYIFTVVNCILWFCKPIGWLFRYLLGGALE